jgi:cytochrome c-type biogenesis protein CcmH/NrfG
VRSQQFTADPVEALTPLLAQDATRNEAAMRLGFFSWRAGHPDRALAYFARVTRPDDPGQAHLVHLFSAWAHDAMKEPDRAIDSLRAALDDTPGAQTASLHLAVRLHAAGRGQDAKAVMDAMLALDPPVFDPWRNFGYGDLRRWPVLIAELRSTLR